MREIRPSGLEGGVRLIPHPYPYQVPDISLPDIHLKDLGTGPDGITAAEMLKLVLAEIEKSVRQVAAPAMADISKGAVYLGKTSGNLTSNPVDTVTKGLGGFLKKK